MSITSYCDETIYTQCTVKASYGAGFPPGQSDLSETEYLGITLLTPSVIVQEGGEARVDVRLSKEFGCGDADDCQMLINTMIQSPTSGCDPNFLVPSQCGVRVRKRDWDQMYSLTIAGKISLRYIPATSVNKLRLRVGSYFVKHPFWSFYDVGDVNVQVVKDARMLMNKICYANQDPHMKTFDGRAYEFHDDGVYTMYQHTELRLEVQIQTKSCSGSSVRCPCGVAVRAGRTVFQINKCGRSLWYINFAMCEDGKDVIKVLRKGSTYQIHLPTGSYVEVIVSPRSRFFNFKMYPSDEDYNKSHGLCGTFNGKCEDDFIKKDGTMSTAVRATLTCDRARSYTRDYFRDFTSSWRASQNLFNYNHLQNLDWWTQPFYYCTCDKNDIVGSEAEPEATCSPGPGRVCVYDERFRPPPSASRPCTIMSRSRRAAAFPEKGRFIFAEGTSKNLLHRKIRQERDTSKNMTEEEAQAFCYELFNRTKTIEVCGSVDTAQEGIMDSQENCILDILLTGTTEFAIEALESAKSQCLHEVAFNTTLMEETTPGVPPIFDTILAVTCANECSGNGNCQNGTCECDHGFGGEDCSLDKSLPPVVLGMVGEGLCDVSAEDCNETAVLGEYFDEFGNISCRLAPFKLTPEGSMDISDSHVYSTPIIESFSEVFCTIPALRQKREAAHGTPETEFSSGYLVSVSNYGDIFSEEFPLIIYNSKCQNCDITDGVVQCTFTTPSCMANGVCVHDGASHPNDPCFACDASVMTRSWIPVSAPGCPVIDVRQNEGEPLWIIGAVLGGLLLAVAIVAAVILCKKMQHPRKVGDTPREFDQNTEMKTPKSD